MAAEPDSFCMADVADQWSGEDHRAVRLRRMSDELINGLSEVRQELAVQSVLVAQLRVEIEQLKRRDS